MIKKRGSEEKLEEKRKPCEREERTKKEGSKGKRESQEEIRSEDMIPGREGCKGERREISINSAQRSEGSMGDNENRRTKRVKEE